MGLENNERSPIFMWSELWDGRRERGRLEGCSKKWWLSSSNMSKERHKPADSRLANFKEAKVKEKLCPGINIQWSRGLLHKCEDPKFGSLDTQVHPRWVWWLPCDSSL